MIVSVQKLGLFFLKPLSFGIEKDATLALEMNCISGIVKTDSGLHIILRTG